MAVTNPRIGAYVLETLTTGMYTDPLDCLREFVQNSMDSILRAERDQVIERGAGSVEIFVDADRRTLSILDSGLGVPCAEVKPRLIDIGMSRKSLETDAGFRGIGRLAAIAYCKVLQFETTAPGEAMKTLVEIDCAGLRQALSPSSGRTYQLADVMDWHTTIENLSCPRSDHMFKVTMVGIDDRVGQFLDVERLQSYLCQVAPVPFDEQKFVLVSEIKDWLRENNITLPTINLSLRTADGEIIQLYKPYRTHYKTARNKQEIHIRKISFYPEHVDSDTPFWLWYGGSDLLGAISDDLSAGFRIRRNNIALGGVGTMRDLFARNSPSDGRFNAYYIGEVHILSKDTVPNARRDGLEDQGAWPSIKAELQRFARDRATEIRDRSKGRNISVARVKHIARRATREAEIALDTGFASEQERQNVKRSLIGSIEQAEIARKAKRDSRQQAELIKIIDDLRKIETKLDEEGNYIGAKLDPRLSRSERKLLTEALRVSKQALEHRTCRKKDECYQCIKTAVLARFGPPIGQAKKN